MLAADRYQVSIEATNVPERLAGAPLSVEIIPPNGPSQRVLLRLSGDSVVQGVKGPGPYLIRTALPSGRLIAEAIAIPEEPNTEGASVGKAVLDLQEYDASAEFWLRAESLLEIASFAIAAGKSGFAADLRKRAESSGMIQKIALGVLSRGVDIGADVIEKLRTGVAAVRQRLPYAKASEDDTRGSSPATDASSTEATAIPYEWGTFHDWASVTQRAPTSEGESSAEPPRIRIRRGGKGSLNVGGKILPPQGGWDRNQPLMIRISAAASAGETLVVWLPSASGLPATLVGDSDGAMQRSGSALLAYGAPEDAVTGTLLSYLQAGALEDARTALPALYKLMDEAKTKSPLGPNTLTLAAYILHKLRDVRADEIIRVLLETYPSIPDAYVIVGQRLIRQGKAEEAPAHFDAALAKGVPIYTEGIRLLRDGSNFLRDLNPTHRHLRRNALQANCLAAAANFKSELSCLRLGHDVAVEFVEDESSSASDSGARVATVPKGPEGSPLGTPVVSAG